MAGTIEEETKRIADVLDGTNTAGPIFATLAKWDAVIAELVSSVTQLTALVTQLTSAVTQLTGVHTGVDAIDAKLGTGNGSLATIATAASGIDADGNALNTTLQTVKTAIDDITVDVTVTDAATAAAVQGQTAARQPMVEQQTIRRDVRSDSVRARTPTKPGAR